MSLKYHLVLTKGNTGDHSLEEYREQTVEMELSINITFGLAQFCLISV